MHSYVKYAGSWNPRILHDECMVCCRHYVGCHCGGLGDLEKDMCYDPARCMFERELSGG